MKLLDKIITFLLMVEHYFYKRYYGNERDLVGEKIKY